MIQVGSKRPAAGTLALSTAVSTTHLSVFITHVTCALYSEPSCGVPFIVAVGFGAVFHRGPTFTLIGELSEKSHSSHHLVVGIEHNRKRFMNSCSR